MNFNDAMTTAARAAADAAQTTMSQYRSGFITDEDDITPDLLATIRTSLTDVVGGLTWTSSVVRHRRGVAAEESRTGADMVIYVRLDTPTEKYAKGVLIQAKRFDADETMGRQQLADLQKQCDMMLAITPSSFVFDYARGSMRVGSATRISGTSSRDLYAVCGWTAYRFFLELFKCPIGDPRLRSALVRDLPVPLELSISASGVLDESE
jgi:hypothetical protein